MNKEFEIKTQRELFDAKINVFATVISGWISCEAEKGNMLPKTAGEIRKEIVAGFGWVKTNEGKPVAYCRVLPWEENLLEIGSLIVDPEKRRQGIGTALVLEMLASIGEKFPRTTVFCLAENDISRRLFEKLGAKEMPKEKLPDKVWELCFKPGAECAHSCHFPNCPCVALELSHLVKKEDQK
jgi:N-acetylglutamate synthase-like GNAT family acetyltransferase